MNRHTFLKLLHDEGFTAVVAVKREPQGVLDRHQHDFEAKALVVSGDLRIRTAAGETQYKAGDMFHLQAQEPHSEAYGPEGVEYWVGRK